MIKDVHIAVAVMEVKVQDCGGFDQTRILEGQQRHRHVVEIAKAPATVTGGMVPGWANDAKGRCLKAQPCRLDGPACCEGCNVVETLPADVFNVSLRMRQCDLRLGGRFRVNQFVSVQ